MPIPFILGAAAVVSGIAGIAKGGKAISNNSRAKELISDAEYLFESAQERMEKQRKETTRDLERLGTLKIESWSDDIGAFVKLFKLFKKVDVKGRINADEQLKMKISNVGNMPAMEKASMKAAEIMQAGVEALGAGALAGVASYGGAMMFATASTGTAISSLTGIAATNATLAWFGGGSIAAGGLGIAGGTAVLGGIVAGPVMAVAGFIMAAKSEENLAKAEKTYSEAENAAEKMDTITDFMGKVSDISNDYTSFITGFRRRYQNVINEMGSIYNAEKAKQANLLLNRIRRFFGKPYKVDYRRLSVEDQKVLHLSWLMTQILYSVLTTPLLTSDGNIASESYEALNSAKKQSHMMLNSGV